MKSLFSIITFLTCVLFANAQTVIFEDQFDNYDLSFDLAGAGYVLWAGNASVVEGDAGSGSRFAVLQPTANNCYFRRIFSLEEGKSYTFEVYTRSPEGMNHRVVAKVGTRTVQGDLVNQTTWTKSSITFTVETGESEVTLWVYSYPVARVDIDGFKLTGNFETHEQEVYYIDPENGTNENVGDTPQHPRKDFIGINSYRIVPGTRILFKAGTQYNGRLLLKDVHGTEDEPVTITSYWDGLPAETLPAMINGASWLSAIQIEDCSHVRIEKICVTANGGGFSVVEQANEGIRCGMLVRTTKPGIYENIRLSEIIVKDVYYYDPGTVRNSSGENDPFGYGIRFYNRTANAILKNISVKNCSVNNVSHTGIRFTGGNGSFIEDIEVTCNEVKNVGGPGMQFGTVRNAYIANNEVDHSGSDNDTRNWKRGSGLWTWGAKNVLIEHNRFTNANGPGDSAGAHIDYNCSDVIIQYNFSAGNAGGFVEILGNNWNCSYRYNISVNDGWRVKGRDGAFQEGKTLWLSGYIGSASPKGPYFSYIYNNTIYVESSIVSKYSIENTTDGLLIANNVFHVKGNSSSVLGDQTSTATKVKTDDGDVFFRNNLFLKTDNWPQAEQIEDAAPLFGDVDFVNPGGYNIVDYIPLNNTLVKGKGIAIPKLSGDTVGLRGGLSVTVDILGNQVGEVIDMGAIAVSTIPNATSVVRDDKVLFIPQQGGFRIVSKADVNELSVYSFTGCLIHSDLIHGAEFIQCNPGIYVVKINHRVYKVIVL
ncbi:MAG: right-handed parallel beta-helix repeat-containing protein [Paludibacter sp.]|nr:right-handed parallel beta-helix repeat-containing protein [Paludibacter sp.]